MKKIASFVLFNLCLFFSSATKSQICSGTTSTVWKDDFGSGLPQLSPTGSPNITSGYIYQNNGVNSGNYSLVNKFDYFGSWHIIPEDHTPGDVNGYFLVIDGNNAAPVFYQTTVRNVCPFTQYSFSTFAMNVDLPRFPSNQTFTFIISDILGNQLATWDSPPIAVTNTPVWVPMGFSFNSGNNTALKLEARFNATGYDDFAFDDFEFSVCGPTLDITTPVVSNTCADSIPLFSVLGSGYANPVYQWQKKDAAGVFVNIPGATRVNYTDNLPADSNVYTVIVGDGGLSCPIKASKEIRVIAAKRSALSKTICNSESFEGHSATGNYVDTFIAANGCDSIRTLQLVVNNCRSNISGIINDYTPVLAFNPCENKITVESAAAFKAGDTVLIIQMKGAVIDSTNTANFGTITNYKNAGNYEFNYVKSVAGNIVELKNVLQRQYDIPVGKVQLIRVPFYQKAVVSDTLTCLPWNGKVGGVLVFNAADTVELNADINTTGKGFHKGIVHNSNINSYTCGINGYYFADNTIDAAGKGEGITALSTNRNSGKGPAANGGGGGMNTNSGGGGGSNGNAGGRGGDELNLCPNHATSQNWGLPGTVLNYSTALNKIFMGGGGGAGHCNNQFYDPTVDADFNGGNGGGIVIINTGFLKNNNKKIISKGDSAYQLNIPNSYVSHDGMGGGGAGGTILLSSNNYNDPVLIDASGGKGGDMVSMPSGGLIGPGGGGGGGVVWIKQNALPAALNITNTGGKGGVIIQNGNDPYGATGGAGGINVFSLSLPVDDVPFKANIDSVRINDSLTACKIFSFKGLAFTNTAAIQNWQWYFGDNSVSSTQNTSHVYSNTGNYTVKLLVTDINGCRDSITKTVRVSDCADIVLNDYAAVTAIDMCTNTMTVDDATQFNAGDTIVIMQMKGAAIDSSNSSNFGTITNYNNAGLYEFNYVKNKTGNTIEFSNTFLNQYDASFGKVQLIRVPYFQTLTVTDTLTCPAWDGFKGGVLVVNSATDITLNAPIDVSNKGFRGGAVGGGFSCNNINNWAAPTGTGGTKGEGIAEYIPGFEAGGARLANGGGGAYAANSGGGGGGNVGPGGLGGSHSNTCPVTTQSMQGSEVSGPTGNRLFLGGGGGGGQQDNNQPVSAGGNGGGIVIIKASTLNSNNQHIYANGQSLDTALVRDEGGAGGGAGGSVMLYVNGYSGNLSIEATGGDGTSNDNTIYPTRCHGPGGGGGGGFFGYSPNALPTFVTPVLNGGRAGTVKNPASACYRTTFNATDGNRGSSFFINAGIPEATVPFKKNIDSVRIKDSLANCKTFDFKGLAYINTTPIKKWQWYFGDGETDSVQNTSHTYSIAGTHPVKLVITDNNGCTDSISKNVITNGINYDFIFEQDACNPLSVSFKAIGDSTPEIFWSIGSTVTNIRNPLHVFPDTGSYLIQYSTGNINTGCIDTVKKVIFIGYRQADIVVTPDTTICFGTGKLLRSNIDSSLRFCWSPNSFLNNVNFANPTTSTPSTATYSLLAASEENNLIVNGNFSNGNSGFTSAYSFNSTGLLNVGEYAVSTSTVNAGLGVADCKDHTTGTGKMLVANSAASGETVWQQQVTVTPNTNYIFSVWVQSPNTASKAMLQLLVNGNKALDSVMVPAGTCTWKKYAVLWNSGVNTMAQLGILDKTAPATITGFDNFAVDDIRFSPYMIKRDTVKITVDTPFVNTRPDTAVCESVPVALTTTGAVRYTWTPVTGLSNPSIASPDATPADTTKYFVTGTNASGCTATDSVTISIKPKPVIVSTGDTMICRNTPVTLSATGGGSYLWSPAALLNDPTSASPVAAASIVNTTYTVTVTGTNNCINKDSFTVSIKAIPVFTVSANQSVCLNDKAQLNATGGNYYLWSPATAVNNATVPDPLAIVTVTTPYSVLIRDTLCGDDTTLTTTVTVLPLPKITAAKENDINCALGSTNLNAAGALRYNWAPATTLNNATISTPIASPLTTTTYTVKGTDSAGCSNTASVTVYTDYSVRVSYSMPNAFSPNGDDKNDCFRVKYFGLVQDIQLSIYNRWGERVFFTTNPNDCWDGTYKGAPCNPGNFVYHLKAKTTCGAVEKKGNVLLVR